jgi:hypothetical protein
MYYVLVKETGEYSSLQYEPIEVFKNLEDAENGKQLYITEDIYLNKISTLRRKPYYTSNFIIFQVNERNSLNFEDELSNLINKYDTELAEATVWREQYNNDRLMEAKKEQEDILQIQKRNIYNFIDKWENCNDDDFQDKKYAKIKILEQSLPSYLKQTNDIYVWDWVRKYHIQF